MGPRRIVETLVAIVERPSAAHPRHTAAHVHVYRGGIGDDIGRELAARLHVPYWNTAPGEPDPDAPRWWHQH